MPRALAPASIREPDQSQPDVTAEWYPRPCACRNRPPRRSRQSGFAHRCVAPGKLRALESHVATLASRPPRPASDLSRGAWESDEAANLQPKLPRNSPPPAQHKLSYPCGSQPRAHRTRATPPRLCRKKYLRHDAWPSSAQPIPALADPRCVPSKKSRDVSRRPTPAQAVQGDREAEIPW